MMDNKLKETERSDIDLGFIQCRHDASICCSKNIMGITWSHGFFRPVIRLLVDVVVDITADREGKCEHKIDAVVFYAASVDYERPASRHHLEMNDHYCE
ncbi:hypothetical protein HPP92_008787 [Vanilla planifolia]|uniref:Uncharacterized protein n=1 Tax=Vanilla planifolia TaxID=51239 RepID=A0A835RIF3_VANPL|nr:hypothetical protein HPP92_008787 [Vanilla planifolia]